MQPLAGTKENVITLRGDQDGEEAKLGMKGMNQTGTNVPLKKLRPEDAPEHQPTGNSGVRIEQEKDPKSGSKYIHIIRESKLELGQQNAQSFIPPKGQAPIFKLETKQQGPDGSPGLNLFLW